jgi:putative aldouronate transport system permease protein
MEINMKRSYGEKVFNVFNIIIVSTIAFSCVYPMIYVIFASFSEPAKLSQHSGMLYKTLGFTLEGYRLVLKNPDIMVGYLNTIFYVVAGTALNITLTTVSAYVLSRKAYWIGKLMFMVTFTMFFSGGIVPLYLTVKSLGLSGTRFAVILPTAMSTWNLIVMRTSFQAVPISLEEAARIDGAKDLTILTRIFIPVCGPIIAVMILFYGVGHWNAWFNAMVYLRKRTMYPLQLFLREILISNISDSMVMLEDVDPTANTDTYRQLVQYCTIVISTVPILCLYPFLQKYFVKGVMIGALKG